MNNELFSWQEFILEDTDYDLDTPSNLWKDSKTLSTTTLCKPDKQLLFTLFQQNLLEETTNITEIPSGAFGKFIGKAIHSYIENKIQNSYPSIFHEKRITKQLNDCIISGKPDIIKNGRIYDVKTTHSFALNSPEKLIAYTKQLSIYKWLAPDLITDDIGTIIYIVKDWKQSNNNAPTASPIIEMDIPLWSTAETERYILNKILLIKDNEKTAYQDYPNCNANDLPRKPSIYKIYRNGNYNRATKVFEDLMSATAFVIENKNKQYEVKEIQSECGVCKYCPFKDVCNQYRKDVEIADTPKDFN